MSKNTMKIIADILPASDILIDEPLCKHTTFKIGGNADYFVKPQNNEQVVLLVKTLSNEKIPFFILGNGSNLLAKDEGFRGVIIYIGENLSNILVIKADTSLSNKKDEKTLIKAGAGAMLTRVSRVACENSLTGMEFACGIPGSIGGAVMMNAGAYSGEIKDIIVDVTVCDRQGNILVLNNEELKLSYRHSIIEEKKYVVLEATFALDKGNKETINKEMMELLAKRKEKQPLEYPSAGSTFKRPEGYFAGKLIMDAGLRGYSVGGAQISEKHCGFVVNKGGATQQDVLKLIEYAAGEVYKKFGVKIEPEVKILEEEQ